MKTPDLQLRRHPLFSGIPIAVGLLLISLGIYLDLLELIFPGVLLILLGGLVAYMPLVVVSDKEIEIKSLFGQTRVSYPHDGYHLLQIQEDKLVIQKDMRRASLDFINKKKFAKADWHSLVQAIEAISASRKKSGKS
jgi:hypothetical protein